MWKKIKKRNSIISIYFSFLLVENFFFEILYYCCCFIVCVWEWKSKNYVKKMLEKCIVRVISWWHIFHLFWPHSCCFISSACHPISIKWKPRPRMKRKSISMSCTHTYVYVCMLRHDTEPLNIIIIITRMCMSKCFSVLCVTRCSVRFVSVLFSQALGCYIFVFLLGFFTIKWKLNCKFLHTLLRELGYKSLAGANFLIPRTSILFSPTNIHVWR